MDEHVLGKHLWTKIVGQQFVLGHFLFRTTFFFWGQQICWIKMLLDNNLVGRLFFQKCSWTKNIGRQFVDTQFVGQKSLDKHFLGQQMEHSYGGALGLVLGLK